MELLADFVADVAASTLILAKFFERKFRVLQNLEKQTFWKISGVDRNDERLAG